MALSIYIYIYAVCYVNDMTSSLDERGGVAVPEFHSAAQPVVSVCDVDPVLTCTLHRYIRNSGY